jgi:hypothetical protein
MSLFFVKQPPPSAKVLGMSLWPQHGIASAGTHGAVELSNL